MLGWINLLASGQSGCFTAPGVFRREKSEDAPIGRSGTGLGGIINVDHLPTSLADLPAPAPRPALHEALSDELRRLTLPTLGRLFGASFRHRSWRNAPQDGAILLMAPHELSAARRNTILTAANWSWVHLTSAGSDFIDLDAWPTTTLLTRSWRCYAAPLAEYSLHAVLSHEWRGGAPWGERDTRATPAPDAPPVPAGGSTGGGAGLWGARVGVAGWGAVGRRLAHTFAALGADVTVLRRRPDDVTRERIAQTTDLDRVLDVDHLVVALPLTGDTVRLFDRRALSRARPGLHLVNISRADILDQDALTELCAAERMFATLDVTDPEPLPEDHPLRHLPTVRLSPHVAWRSRGSDSAFIDDFAAIWQALRDPGSTVPGAVAPTEDIRARAAVSGASTRGKA